MRTWSLSSIVKGEWQYQEVWGRLFGFSSAVLNFNRWPRFLQAVTRRVLGIMFAMYIDGAAFQDVSSAKGSGQDVVRKSFAMIGAPLAPDKSVTMASKSDFVCGLGT